MPVNKNDPYGPAKAEPTKAGRDYIGEAVGAFAVDNETFARAANNPSIVAAVIVAQALDRLGRKMVEAAAISKTRA